MRPYRLSQHALADLRALSDWIASDKPVAALRWLERMYEFFSLLTTQPEMGERCDELRPGLRRMSSGNYVVYFRSNAEFVEIVRVVHGSIDIGRIF